MKTGKGNIITICNGPFLMALFTRKSICTQNSKKYGLFPTLKK